MTARHTPPVRDHRELSAETFLVRHQGDGADARLIQGRPAMVAHIRDLCVGSDDPEVIAESGMSDHLATLLNATDPEWLENGEPPSYSMSFEDGSTTVYLVTSTAALSTANPPTPAVEVGRDDVYRILAARAHWSGRDRIEAAVDEIIAALSTPEPRADEVRAAFMEAIDFACDVEISETHTFLTAWREGSTEEGSDPANEWADFRAWRDKRRASPQPQPGEE